MRNVYVISVGKSEMKRERERERERFLFWGMVLARLGMKRWAGLNWLRIDYIGGIIR
jgi:hypothetical protein